ncbi:MAG: alpha-1,4 polygalactosaminidase [Flavobacteriales bacterium]|nr:alpha-1,4 polygalactosaminidase [Flavobacteriales bacterium]
MSDTHTIELDMTTGNNQWQPAIGQETSDLLDHFGTKLDDAGRQNLVQSTQRILGQCAATVGEPTTSTGLVVGYVQSGKTMSFTTVTTMAVDNGYPIVIVITGISNNLYRQSAERLERDLRLNSRQDRKWQHFKEPRQNEAERISQILRDWRDPTVPERERQFLLITIKKNWSVLRRLIAILRNCELRGLPALIIDDEADQASLNTKVNDDDESVTYARIRGLRNLFACHTFLQYTATPQANLLINILDSLSPDFAELLVPGEDYTGGIEFFGQDMILVRDIPVGELPDRRDPNPQLPATLAKALRLFFVGVAIGRIKGEAYQGKNRSMLIHPSRETIPHGQYAQWVRGLMRHWETGLCLPETDTLRGELLDDFREAYDDLRATVHDDAFPDWPSVAADLKRAIAQTVSGEVNSTDRRIADIDWRRDYARILIGGQALDRGFTVEGLTVTYMPRGLGSMGAADTLQQRARFFGYKRSYLGYCRLYLDADVRGAFQDYVAHEESMREELNDLRTRSVPLKQWRRAFILSSRLEPTRRNVLSLSHLRDSYADRWFWVKAPHVSDESCRANRQAIDSFIAERQFAALPTTAFGAPAARHTGIRGVPLADVCEQLLFNVGVPEPEENQAYVGVLFQIDRFLRDHPQELCDVYLMRPDDNARRAVNAGDEIDNIFQGSNRQPGDPEYYPGDREIHADGRLTIKLRRLTLTRDGNEVATDVPVLAVWVPASMEQQWLVQEPLPQV